MCTSRLAIRRVRLSAWICGLVVGLVSSAPGAAWPGYRWEEWKEVTTWTKPELKTDQVGRHELSRLLGSGEDGAGASDEIRAWEQKRGQIAEAIRKVLGQPTGLKDPQTWPASASVEGARPGPETQLLGEETLDDHIRRHIRIRCEPDDWIPAYVLLPRKMPDSPVPAMICLHQTVPQGKQEPCGMKGSKDLALALELVRRGYICIAPDMIGFGERIPPGAQCYHDSIAFYRRHPGWSFMGKMIWDVGRIVDYLESLSCVDGLQIGCIGHSHGAYGALFAAAFEPRISLAVASCGFTTLRSDPAPDRWSHQTALIPQLGLYLPDVASIPFDWHQVCALIAPRPLFVWYGLHDAIFPNTDNLEALFKDVRTVYGLYGAADDLAWHAFDGAHGFSEVGRALAYEWLEQRLFPVGDLKQVPGSPGEWEKRRRLIQRVIRRTIGTPAGEPPPPEVNTVETETLPHYERRLVEYSVEKGERVRAYLCVPRMEPRPLPGVLVLHQTAPQGKREPVGLEGQRSLAFAADLAERGYVTLAPDSIAAGERVERFGPFDTRGHYTRHPELSAMGKLLYDAQRAVDLLARTEGVDAARIAALGHSLGAEEALLLAAFDERVRATVVSCGYATFRAESRRDRWARDHWFSYMPKLRPVLLRGQLPHWDWGDVIRLVAPRALYQHNTTGDKTFPQSESAYEAGEAARAIWRLYGQAERLVNVLKPGPHDVAEDTRADMYEWLDRQLKGQ